MPDFSTSPDFDSVQGGRIFPTRIYVMKDPRDGMVRYVGKTFKGLQKRLTQHIEDSFDIKSKSFKSNKSVWIRNLYEEGYFPVIETIEICQANWAEREMYWIAHYNELGFNLMNMTEGGEHSNPLIHKNVINNPFLRQQPSSFYGTITEAEVKLERLLDRRGRTSEAKKAMETVKRSLINIDALKNNVLANEILFHIYMRGKKFMTIRELLRSISNPPTSHQVNWIFDILLEKKTIVLKSESTAGRPRVGYIHRDFNDKAS